VARTLIAVAVALACAAPARADVYAAGQLARDTAAGSTLSATVTNASTAGEALDAVRITLPAPAIPSSPGCQAPAPRILECSLAAPLAAGQSTVVQLTADPRVADGAGASLEVCAAPCAGAYVGPFLMEGPAPARPATSAALTSVAAWRAERHAAGDSCSAAKTLFGTGVAAVCADRGATILRGIIVNAGELPLTLRISAPGWRRRVRVPGSGGAGFQRKGRLKAVTTLTFTNAAGGPSVALKLRLGLNSRRG
jgi:hypothetical protein